MALTTEDIFAAYAAAGIDTPEALTAHLAATVGPVAGAAQSGMTPDRIAVTSEIGAVASGISGTIVYPSAMSDTDRQGVETYLNTKYGL